MMHIQKWMFALLAAVALSVAGCTASNVETKSVETAADVNVKSGINNVLQEVKKLEEQLAASPSADMIRQLGKSISQKWDSFEDEVEDQYPEQYEKIEANLYPLIAETGKQKLDVAKIKELVQKVQQDLMKFLEELA